MALAMQAKAKPDPERLAILTLTPEAFSALMHLPEGAELIGLDLDIRYRGLLRLKIQGAGWKTLLGGAIPEAEPGTVARDENGRLSIDWHLPSSEGE